MRGGVRLEIALIRGPLGQRVFSPLLFWIWDWRAATTGQRGHVWSWQQCWKALWPKSLGDFWHSAEAVEHDPMLPRRGVQEHSSARKKQSQWNKGTTAFQVWAAVIISDKNYTLLTATSLQVPDCTAGRIDPVLVDMTIFSLCAFWSPVMEQTEIKKTLSIILSVLETLDIMWHASIKWQHFG